MNPFLVITSLYLTAISVVAATPCGDILNATDTWQTFSSPGYPVINYQSNLYCSWIIRKTGPGFLELKSKNSSIQFSIRCQKDYISIDDGKGKLLRYCGQQPFYRLMTDDVQQLQVKFISDSSGTDVGFQAQYRLSAQFISTRAPVVTPEAPTENLKVYNQYYYVIYSLNNTSSHDENSYDRPSTSNKVWVIDTETDDYTVLVKFAPSYMDCATDSVKVYDGYMESSALLATWCDGQARTVKSTGRVLRIHFYSPLTTSDSSLKFKFRGDVAQDILDTRNVTVIVGGTLSFLSSLGYLALFLFCMLRKRDSDKKIISIPIPHNDDSGEVMTSSIQITVNSKDNDYDDIKMAASEKGGNSNRKRQHRLGGFDNMNLDQSEFK